MVSMPVALLDCGSLSFRSAIHITRKLNAIGDPQFFKDVEQRVLYCALADFKHARDLAIAHTHCHQPGYLLFARAEQGSSGNIGHPQAGLD